ncbi:MAG: response regulator [Chitinophagales bacterium]
MKNSNKSPQNPLNILLADDDLDDCFLFTEALEELQVDVQLKMVHDGEQLMQWLTDKANKLPDILFLDINMPRKNGLDCLSEIKNNELLQNLSVVIFSTSSDNDMVVQVYKDAAHYYIHKPPKFSQLKNIIQNVLSLLGQENSPLPLKEKFILTGITENPKLK